MCFALWVFDAHDQHMLGQPAFAASLVTGNSQGVTFLAQQGVATVARPKTLDHQILGKMHDKAAFRVEITDGVQTLHKAAFTLNTCQRSATHAGHHAHICNNVWAVCNFHAAT